MQNGGDRSDLPEERRDSIYRGQNEADTRIRQPGGIYYGRENAEIGARRFGVYELKRVELG